MPSGLNATAETFSRCSSGLPTIFSASQVPYSRFAILASADNALAVGTDRKGQDHAWTLDFKLWAVHLCSPFFQHLPANVLLVDRIITGQGIGKHQDAVIDFALLAKVHSPAVIILGQKTTVTPFLSEFALAGLYRGIALFFRCLFLSFRVLYCQFPCPSARFLRRCGP